MSQRVSRRNFVKLVVVGMAGGLLAACATPAAQSTQAPAAAQPTQAPAKAGGKTTVQLWSHYGTGKTGQTLHKLVEGEYNKSQNDVEVAITDLNHPDMWPKVLAAIAAGAPPDSFTYTPVFPPELAKEGHGESVEKFMKWPDDIFPAVDPQFNGVRFGIPMASSTRGMFYNEGLFTKAGLDPAKPPATWGELVTQAKQLTKESEKQFGLLLPTRPVGTTTEFYLCFLWGAGGDFLSPDNKQALFNSAAGVEALQWWVDAFQTHRIAPLVEVDGAGLINTYGTGAIGTVTQSSTVSAEIAAFNFKSRTTPMPAGKQRASLYARNYYVLMKGAKNNAATCEFFKWWLQPEVQSSWASMTGMLPVRKSATDHQVYQDYMKKEPMAKAFVDSMEFAKPFPMVVGISEIQIILAEAVAAAVYKKSAPKDALDQAAKKVNDLLKQNG